MYLGGKCYDQRLIDYSHSVPLLSTYCCLIVLLRIVIGTTKVSWAQVCTCDLNFSTIM